MGRISKVARIGGECVACGSCVAVCPRGAIWIDSGVTARIQEDMCVGCGKCAQTCPADVIEIMERRAVE